MVSIDKLKEERNRIRRRAKKQGQDTKSLRSLANKFHLLLRQYKRISRAEKKRSSKQVAHNERLECA